MSHREEKKITKLKKQSCHPHLTPPLDINAQTESERTQRRTRSHSGFFVRAEARQFKADSHMPAFNIQTITQSLAAQESEIANTLTLRKIDLKLHVLFFFSFFFVVTSFLKTVSDAGIYFTALKHLHLKAT